MLLPLSLSLSLSHIFRLQQLVDSITHNFRQKAPDLMTNEFERDSVKLHATVMNAKFPAQLMESKEGRARDGERNMKKFTFDATNVFKVCNIHRDCAFTQWVQLIFAEWDEF